MKTKKKPAIWLHTLVRHSAWTVVKNPQFQHAVQEALVHGEKDAARIRKAGGLVYAPSKGSDDVEYSVNYPPGTPGLIPRATGTFARQKFDGSEIYVPGDDERAELLRKYPKQFATE